MGRAYRVFSCLLLAAAFCAAQSAPPTPETRENSAQAPAPSQPKSPDAPSSAQPPQSKADDQQPADDRQSRKDEANTKATSNDRLFFTLPNFLTLENAGQVPPMTVGQKFKVIVRSSFDPIQIPWYGFLAAISQGEKSERGYGQGAAGYGKRFGAYAADGTIESFMVSSILPSVFRQDPRYFQSGHGGFWKRAGYSVSRLVVTRNDPGHNGFNLSEIAGSGIASAISTYSYHPAEDHTLGNTMSVWGSQLGYDTITFVAREFWPDIRRKIKKQHRSQE